jgi:glycosyltransferase involved in cell wall biosynthesis
VPVIEENYQKLYPNLLFPGKTQFIEGAVSSSIGKHVHPWNPLSWSTSAKHLASLLAHENPVYLYSHWHPFFSLSQYSIISKLKSLRPDVITAGIFHNVQPHERFPFQQRLTRSLIEVTDVPVVLSSQTETEFLEFTKGRRPYKLFHPVYEQSYPGNTLGVIRSKLGIGQDEFVLLFFGLVREYKGLDLLIDSLNTISMAEHRLRLLVAGEFYIDPDVILNRVTDKNKDRIQVYNRFVSDTEAAEFMSVSNAMVLPYRSASQSGVMSDALFFELPVIVSDLPGLTEHINHEEHGYIVPVGDVPALSDAILRISRPSAASQMHAGIRNLKQSLTWDRFSEELITLLTTR